MTVPFGRVPLVITGAVAEGEPIVMEMGADAVLPEASFAVIVRLEVPVAVGVPLMTPVAGLRARPEGRVPAVMLKVYGVVPPVACTVVVYGVPMVPPGGFALTIARAVPVPGPVLPAAKMVTVLVAVMV